MSNFDEQVRAAQLAVLLDALDGVPLSDAERRALEVVSGLGTRLGGEPRGGYPPGEVDARPETATQHVTPT